MADEFNDEISDKMNSLSALAVANLPVNEQLQKLLTDVSELLQIPAAILLLHSDFLLSPRYSVAGVDERLVQTFRTLYLQKEGERYFELLFAPSSISTAMSARPIRRSVNNIFGQDYELVVIPLLVGTQQLGVIALATQTPDTLIREKDSLLRFIAAQVGVLLLLLKAVQHENQKSAQPLVKDWLPEEFLATLSHELRAPLHVILGWVNLLQQPNIDKELSARALKIIERSARAQKYIINEMLDASYSFNKELEANKRPVLVNSILQQVVKTLQPEAAQKEIRVTTNIHVSNDYVLADSERLRQAFWHLLSNAIKFTAHKGRIHLSARRVENTFALTLTDSGVGIAPEFLPYVFDPFRQEEFATTRKFGGLGLGLAIVRHQIELHGGSIDIESAGKNQGATVFVRLPLLLHPYLNIEAAPLAESDPLPDQAMSCDNLEGLRVLVVDDDADSLVMVSTILQHCNSEVQTAESGADALTIMQDWQPDVLISDVELPGVDGYELIRRLRRENSTFCGRTAAIALTAFARSEDRLRALASGFHTHLPKPVDPTELLAVINSLVLRRAAKLAMT